MKLAVVVGRFQVDELTLGHKNLIKFAEQYDKVLIIVGEPFVFGTRRNPLSSSHAADAVWGFLNDYYHDFLQSKFNVHSLSDKKSDLKWSEELDVIIDSYLIDGMEPILIGGRDSFLDSYYGKYKYSVKEIDPYGDHSGTETRTAIACRDFHSVDFRRGVIWAAWNRRPMVYSTVDVIPFDDTTRHILMGRKKDEDLIRFIGGFVDHKDLNLAYAAAREIYEEAYIAPGMEYMQYISSLVVNDYRYRDSEDVVMTHIFTCAVASNSDVIASDDLHEVFWVKLDDLNEDGVIESHRPILAEFIKWETQNG